MGDYEHEYITFSPNRNSGDAYGTVQRIVGGSFLGGVRVDMDLVAYRLRSYWFGAHGLSTLSVRTSIGVTPSQAFSGVPHRR